MTQFGLDNVNGIVIGDFCRTGKLFYDGRQQGAQFIGDNDEDLRAQGKAKLAAYRVEYGDEFARLYPDPGKWELRIWD